MNKILCIIRYVYHYGWWALLKFSLDRSCRPQGLGWLYFIRYGISSVGRCFPWTMNAAAVKRLVEGSEDVEIFLSHIYGGGATSYLKNWVESSPVERLIFIVRPSSVVGVLQVEPYKSGVKGRQFFVHGLSAFNGLKGRKCRIVVSELLTWEMYWPENRMSNRRMAELCRGIVALRNRLSAEMLYLVHDFYSMCPRFDLVTPEYRYCDSEFSLVKCRDCLADAQNEAWGNARGIDIVEWRGATKKMLDACREIRAFSEDSKARIMRCWPELSVTVVPHKFVGGFTRKPVINRGQLTIGVFGSIGRHKGSEEVLSLGRYLLEKDEKVPIVVVGNIDVPDGGAPENIRVLGSYKTQDLPDIVERENISVAFFSSVCAESFSYVTQELIALGLPVACYNVGAPKDRVRDYPDGRVIPEVTTEATWRTIKGLYEEMKAKYGGVPNRG